MSNAKNEKNGKNTGNNNDISKRFDPWKFRILPEHREFSDEIYGEIKEGTIARKYRDIYTSLYNTANTANDQAVKSNSTNSLKTLNGYMVSNILKSNQSEINDEIKNNILAELDKYVAPKNDGKNPQFLPPNQEVIQATA
jgi:hypothetical protein